MKLSKYLESVMKNEKIMNIYDNENENNRNNNNN